MTAAQNPVRRAMVGTLETLGLKSAAQSVLDVGRLVYGYGVYRATKATPRSALQSLTTMFCKTRGRSNDLLSSAITMFRPPVKLDSFEGVFGTRSEVDVKAATEVLRREGYVIAKPKLPEDVCARLMDFARKEPCVVNPLTPDRKAKDQPRAVYDPVNPIAVRYYMPDEVLIDHPDVQALISDPSIIALAQEYLGSQPILDMAAMWWSTSINDEPSIEDAQMYHFDMDRIRWVKFFFYLTDVTQENGPHCYIAKSHKTNGIPAKLLKRGYVRITDEELRQHYPAEDFIEFTGPKGMILAEDTRGFHKGKLLEKGDRLLFQLQFTNSLFGGTVAKNKTKFGTLRHPRLIEMVRRHPEIYSYYL